MKAIQNKKPLTLPAIMPNAGIQRKYARSLIQIVQEIRHDINQALAEEFKQQAKQKKKVIAQDGLSDWVASIFSYLFMRWQHKLDDLAMPLAKQFVNRTVSNYDQLMTTYLRKAGFTVRFQPTQFQTDALQAVLENNVSLIKSIPQQYLERVQVQVYQSVMKGYDIAGLSEGLKKAYDITKRRADFIARDQTSKAHATIERAKRQELGITKAIWLHSHAGVHPRLSHVAADGKVFDVSKGMYLDGEWVQPGELINCRCASKSIIEGIGA